MAMPGVERSDCLHRFTLARSLLLKRSLALADPFFVSFGRWLQFLITSLLLRFLYCFNMFRYVQRCPLRRYVHTSTSRPVSSALRSRVGMALGASAAVTTYVAWKTLHGQSIALDSVSPSCTCDNLVQIFRILMLW